MKTLLRTPLAVWPLLALLGCSTAPVAEGPGEGAATADGQDPYNTRGTDVYTYQPQGAASGQDLGTSGSYGGAYGQPGGGQAGYGQPGYGQPGGAAGGTGNDRIVYFDFDSFDVRPEYRPLLEAQARYLLANPGAAVTLEGHADERGTREYNIGLGERRSDSVQRMLRAYGVPPQQIRVVSYGEERPAALGSDEGSYGRNRRVELAY